MGGQSQPLTQLYGPAGASGANSNFPDTKFGNGSYPTNANNSDLGLFFNGPAAGNYPTSGGPGPGLAPYGGGTTGGKGPGQYSNTVPTGQQGPQQTQFDPTFAANSTPTVNNMNSGSYFTQGHDYTPPGVENPFQQQQPLNGFSFNNPYLLGAFQNLWGGSMSPMGMSNAWSSGGLSGVPGMGKLPGIMNPTPSTAQGINPPPNQLQGAGNQNVNTINNPPLHNGKLGL